MKRSAARITISFTLAGNIFDSLVIITAIPEAEILKTIPGRIDAVISGYR